MNITSNDTSLGDLGASYENQRTYWGTSFFVTGAALLGLIYVGIEARRNRAFQTPTLKAFSVIFTGDILFTVCYFPYHAYNSILAWTGGEFQDPKDSPLCLVSWFFIAISIQLQFFGFAFLGYAPYKMILDSSKLRMASSISKLAYTIAYGGATASALMWFSVGIANQQLGSYRGLYCAASSWANFQGFYMFLSMFIALSIFFVLFLITYLRLQKMGNSSSPGTQGETSEQQSRTKGTKRTSAKSGSRAILKFGTVMMANFLLTWGTFALTAFWNTFSPYIGSLPPLELEMVAGVAAKTKPILDVWTILSMPTVKKERLRRRNKVEGKDTVGTSLLSSNQSGADAN